MSGMAGASPRPTRNVVTERTKETRDTRAVPTMSIASRFSAVVAGAAGLLVGFLLLSAGIGTRGLMETSEGRYGSMAAEMARSGDFVVPRINGVKRFEKPPLSIWAMATSLALLGESEWAL